MELRQRFDIFLLICVYAVIGIGIFTLYSQEVILENAPDRWLRQAIYALVGSFFLILLSNLNYQNFMVYAFPLYCFSLFLLVLTLIPGVGSEVNGARSWLRIGNVVGFQTSELAKLATIILLATYLTLKEREMGHLSSLLIPFFITIIPVGLIVIQPDFGSAFSLLPVLLAILLLAGADYYHIGAIMTFVSLSLLIPIYVEYHNIILLPNLLEHLEEIGNRDLLPAVRILKTNIWEFISKAEITTQVASQDQNYLQRILQSEKHMNALQQAATTVRYEAGGFLLIILEQVKLLIGISLVFLVFSVFLIGIRLMRGNVYANLRKLYIPLGIIGISLLIAAGARSFFSFRPHQVARVTAFINPEKFPRDLAYQIRASKAAIGSGEALGRGVWQGEMTLGRRPLVPEAYTDFIFTSWAERTGFVGSIFLLLLLMAIPLRSLLLSSEIHDRFGSLLVGGISFLFLFHIVVNIGIGLGLLPVTGLPLSFMSYGGSHLVVSLAAVGILMSVYRRKFVH